MRPALSRAPRLLIASSLLACSFAVAGPAQAAEPLGGPKLGSKGIVYDSTPGTPAPPTVAAEGWLVADLDSGAVVGARNAHGKFLPASTIKTLTALALLPKLSSDTVVKPSQAAANTDGTRVGIKPGFPISIDLLFTGMLIYSGNDTATALAEAAGGEATTVRLMNEQAKRIRADDTLAVNPSGLDASGQYSSPYDLALMGRAALKLDAYRRYTQLKRATVPAPTGSFQIANKNRLLYTYEGAFGGKTGGTKRALQTYVGYAERGSRRLVVTLMKTTQWHTEATKLLDWGFAAAGMITPVGELVLPLDEVPATPKASSAPAVGPATSSSAAAPSSSTSAAAAPASSKPRVAATPIKKSGLRDRLPALHWWYFAGPVGLAGLVAIGLAFRRRRRRRRGFYMPQTKLRLPVR